MEWFLESKLPVNKCFSQKYGGCSFRCMCASACGHMYAFCVGESCRDSLSSVRQKYTHTHTDLQLPLLQQALRRQDFTNWKLWIKWQHKFFKISHSQQSGNGGVEGEQTKCTARPDKHHQDDILKVHLCKYQMLRLNQMYNTMCNVQILIVKINKYLFKYSHRVWMSVESFITVSTTASHNISDCFVMKCHQIVSMRSRIKVMYNQKCKNEKEKKHPWLGHTKNPTLFSCMCEEMCLGVRRLSHQAKRGTLTDSGPTDSWDSASSSCSWQACCTPARCALDTLWSSSRSTARKGENKKDRRAVNRSFKFKIRQCWTVEKTHVSEHLPPIKHSPVFTMIQLIKLQCATCRQ